MMNRNMMIVLFCLCAFSVSFAQEPTPTEAPQVGPQRPPGLALPSQEPQPYEKVITKEAKSKKGVFTVHQIKDKYYYEIPRDELNKEFLWNTRHREDHAGCRLRWRRIETIAWCAGSLMATRCSCVRSIYGVVADPRTPISLAVKAATTTPY